MDQGTAERLLRVNDQFYQTFALQFSLTRQRLQPGVKRILESLPKDAHLLDLGCGNGELAQELARRGHTGAYTGLDLSEELLAEARLRSSQDDAGKLLVKFLHANLAEPGWEKDLVPGSYDAALAFAVFHHLPSTELRTRAIQAAWRCLKPGGRFIHSEWQFLNSSKLSQRIQPWEAAGLNPGQVDPGDYLLDWRGGGQGLRYVHLFSVDELALLAAACHFKIQDTFYSDGVSGDLGLYQVWEKG